MSKARIVAAALLSAACISPAHSATSSWFQGLYVRAEGGYSNAQDAGLRDDDRNSANCFLIAAAPPPRCDSNLEHLGGGAVFGIGIGLKLPKGFRADLMINHRRGFELKGRDTAGTDFDPPVKSNSAMVSGTFDLPVVLGRVKPFIGGGVGVTRNKMDPINWNDPTCCRGTLPGGKKTDRAWQVTIGADIVLANAWTLEVLFRHTDLGKIVKEAGRDVSGPAFNASGITGSATGKLRVNEFAVAVRRDL